MDNININDLLQVAKGYEVAEAFGVTEAAVSQWKKQGDIPDFQRYRYSKGLLPDGKKKALVLYKRALKKMREQNEI